MSRDRELSRYYALREAGHVQRAHCVPHHGSYSVAEHTWQVVTLILLLHPDPSRDLLLAAHWHDAPERWTGDVPAPAKWMDGDYLEEALRRVERRVHEVHGTTPKLTDEDRAWLKACDMLEFYLWCLDQLSMGNNHVLAMHDQAKKVLRDRWDDLPGEVRLFLDWGSGGRALTWRRTPDRGWWVEEGS